MADDPEMAQLAMAAVECRLGSVIAAAGFGKTELLAKALGVATARRLVLTHTHAGVDALKLRLKQKEIPSSRYVLDTIAGWSLRFAANFPATSGITPTQPKTTEEWQAVYVAASRLIDSGAIDEVLAASYSGVLVDEYQDCDEAQHAVLVSLSGRLPTCVVGDEMQAIFDFKGQVPVDWAKDVFSAFPPLGALNTPHRWLNAGSDKLAGWLAQARTALTDGKMLDLRSDAINYVWLPDRPGPRRAKIIATAKAAMGLDGRVLIIADPANEARRATIAQGLAKQGFSTLEPVSSKTLMAAAKAIQGADDAGRLTRVLAFLEKCMIGVRPAQYLKAVASRAQGGKLGAANYGHLVELGYKVGQAGGAQYVLPLLEAFEQWTGSHTFRREMLAGMKSALKMQLAKPGMLLSDAAWHVQNRLRHLGRRIPKRCVGSTLLVKGLEFEHVIVVQSENMGRRDWYVALTRGTKSLTVLAAKDHFVVPD